MVISSEAICRISKGAVRSCQSKFRHSFCLLLGCSGDYAVGVQEFPSSEYSSIESMYNPALKMWFGVFVVVLMLLFSF